tara:strand:+ start:25239 stop:26027 length:789 start_codon:yes stop_codon:yes gene_type:complete
MTNILDEICRYKRKEVEISKKNVDINFLKKNIIIKNFNFTKKIIDYKKNNKTCIIAEIKKASPSKGIFVDDFDHMKIANEYIQSKVACLSIVTEEKYFLGKKKYIEDVRNISGIPILCKDFFVDLYQIYEASSIGADCILILIKNTDIKLIRSMYKLAEELGLNTIMEVHNEDEMKVALKFDNSIIGINNRNLENFSVDINNTISLYKKFDLKNRIVICESGIENINDVKKIKENTNINNFLIGESLIKSNSISQKIKELSQ